MVIVLYFWTFYTGSTDAGLLINGTSVVMAAVSFLVGTVFYLWSPSKFITLTAPGVYLSLAATAVSLIASSGGAESPFIALWILIAIFAGVFGVFGIAPL